jgi:hypothetical protein
MRKRLMGMAVVGVMALSPLAGASVAHAATPQGSCPPTFGDPVPISSLSADLQGFATFIDTQVGGNNDGLVCVTTLAPNSQGNGTRLNILDNRVAGF